MNLIRLIWPALAVGVAFGACAFTETPSSPAERAATAKLNRDMAAANAAADDRYAALKKQYDQQKEQNDEEQKKYQLRVKEHDLLEQEYQQKLKTYQEQSGTQKPSS
jgi:hypothetical protein